MGTIWIVVAMWVLIGTVCASVWALVGMSWRMRRLEERNAAQAATIAGLQKRLSGNPWCPACHQNWQPGTEHECGAAQARSIWNRQADAESVRKVKDRLFGDKD